MSASVFGTNYLGYLYSKYDRLTRKIGVVRIGIGEREVKVLRLSHLHTDKTAVEAVDERAVLNGNIVLVVGGGASLKGNSVALPREVHDYRVKILYDSILAKLLVL